MIVNLAPADIRKEGSAYDLPMALSILQASGQVDQRDTTHDSVELGAIQAGQRIVARHVRDPHVARVDHLAPLNARHQDQ